MKDLTPEHPELEREIIETVEAGNVPFLLEII